MLLIHKTPQPDRVITIGQGTRVIQPPAPTVELPPIESQASEALAEPDDLHDGYLYNGESQIPTIPDKPPVEVKKNKGRPKMSKDLEDSSGVKTIHKEDAGKQGPVGTGDEQNPPQPAAGEDVKVGNEEKANG